MPSHAPIRETVVWLGIRVDSSAFKGLAAKHRAFIDSYARSHLSNFPINNEKLKPILHQGEVIGYGFALYELVPHNPPVQLDGLPEFTRAYNQAATAWWNVFHRIEPPLEPKLFFQAG